MTQVAPSLLSANFGNLDADIDMLNNSKASLLHIDVMDGVFVPNISFGFPVMKAVARRSKLPMDVHLMIVNPQNYISQVRDCGALYMNVHVEACTHLNRTVQAIHAAGMKAGVTLNPATPLVMVEEILNEVDMVLLMSVNPGFGGQKFIESSTDKVRRLAQMIEAAGSSALIEVDGGVNGVNAPDLVQAGADILVAGNYVFSAPDPLKVIAGLAEL